MLYILTFLAGIAFPWVAWFVYGVAHDYIYLPLIWEPRHRRWCRTFEERCKQEQEERWKDLG